MRQHGFISLPLTGYLALAAGAVILAIGIALKVQTSRLNTAQTELATEKANYKAFQVSVKAAGDAQIAKNEQTLKEREKINGERFKALQSRYADIAAKYGRLRGESANSRAGSLPDVPTTARAPDDAARDSQILGILEHAEIQAVRLQELQEWLRQTAISDQVR